MARAKKHRGAQSLSGDRKHVVSWLSLTLGVFLGISLLKFGNPATLAQAVPAPADLLNFIFAPWPLAWAQALLAAIVVLALATETGWQRPNNWILALPLPWIVWQLIATTTTVDAGLSRATLIHFLGVVACFYLGYRGLNRHRSLALFWTPLLAGFAIVLWTGFGQHYGGLEATRQLLYTEYQPEQIAPELLARIATNRIFGTLFYPNALAGIILLLFLPLTWHLHRATQHRPNIIRGTLLGLLSFASLACLYWSGSKAGWLIGVLLAGTLLLHLQFATRWKVILTLLLLVTASTGFYLRYADYFQRGATSAVARFQYWQAAWTTAIAHPWTGTGPGTFAIAYAKIKPPDAEMSRLAHNDYLEQASDSGFPGMIAYLAFLPGLLAWLYRRSRQDPLRFSVWLGLAAWALQSVVEFGLYIPALSWTAFCLLGWLAGRPPIAVDTKPASK